MGGVESKSPTFHSDSGGTGTTACSNSKLDEVDKFKPLCFDVDGFRGGHNCHEDDGINRAPRSSLHFRSDSLSRAVANLEARIGKLEEETLKGRLSSYSMVSSPKVAKSPSRLIGEPVFSKIIVSDRCDAGRNDRNNRVFGSPKQGFQQRNSGRMSPAERIRSFARSV